MHWINLAETGVPWLWVCLNTGLPCSVKCSTHLHNRTDCWIENRNFILWSSFHLGSVAGSEPISLLFRQFIGLLQQHWMTDDKEYGAISGMNDSRNRSTGECPPHISVWHEPGSNTGHRGENPATNRLQHGQICRLLYIIAIPPSEEPIYNTDRSSLQISLAFVKKSFRNQDNKVCKFAETVYFVCVYSKSLLNCLLYFDKRHSSCWRHPPWPLPWQWHLQISKCSSNLKEITRHLLSTLLEDVIILKLTKIEI
jgi:hypothetical protein